ncbi:hypothetical protein HYDPIDRAFT_137858 [Hydnomerulius pinastri MD-312]|uniref:F-box domain-containing protein n=1 Tax=Hydnomerulius pinastri MD-312 TaxID=994086 RepID=A0A0C9VTH9_9AGAM|nr:hypothetical protein HYDPIDRAFT_137858 [Hydnomerulius pinastri MD-312]
MHDVLCITELLDVICQFATRSTLAKLARTCRAFEEPALDALWKDLETLAPLSNCLPPALWGELDGVTILRRPLSSDHWRLLRKYSSRICTVQKNIFFGRYFRQLLAVASHSTPPAPLFPKLKAVLLNRITDETIPLFRWMIGPSITKLELSLSIIKATPATLSFMSSLGMLCPNMRSVLLEVDHLEKSQAEVMAASMSQAICQWYHLQNASFSSLDAFAYEHLSQLKSLTTLKLFLSRDAPTQLGEAELCPTPFPSLTNLTIGAVSIEVMSAWLSCLHLAPTNLTCNIHDVPFTPTTLYELCSTIQKHCCPHSLRSIDLDDLRSRYGETVVLLDDIQPLLEFRHLRSVTLHELCTIALDDHALEELATAWPQLEVLHLNRYAKLEPAASIPTFRGLFHLVRLCPNLRELSIVIDLTKTEWIDIRRPSDEGVCNSALSTLILGNSPLDDPKRVAFILGAVFPCLAGINLDDWDYLPLYLSPERDTSLPLWCQLNDYLADFGIVREQEIRRMQAAPEKVIES